MKRRTLIAASLAALPASRAFAAERTIGWTSIEPRDTTEPFLKALKAGLLLHRGGDQVRILERNVTTGPDDMAKAVDELQRQGVSLIVTQGASTPMVVRARPTVPVVFGFSADPIVAGVAQSLARPGGNVTGVTFMSVELMPKRIDLLRTALPTCRRVGLLSNTTHFGEENEIVACQRAVERLGVELSVYRVKSGDDIPPAVVRSLDDGVQAVLVLPSSSMVRQASTISSLALARNVPVVSGWASIAQAGALLTYGPNLQEAYKRVAAQAMRVLNGTPASNLPIEQPTIFELAVNMKTAAALNIKLPPALLAQADEVIE